MIENRNDGSPKVGLLIIIAQIVFTIIAIYLIATH